MFASGIKPKLLHFALVLLGNFAQIAAILKPFEMNADTNIVDTYIVDRNIATTKNV